MSSFKVSITLESHLSSQELADFFAALAQSERGNVEPLLRVLQPAETHRVLHPVEPPPPPSPPSASASASASEAPPVVVVSVTEPTVTDDIKRSLMSTEISCQRLNSIIRRHNWARGKKAQIERRWGFSKASCFARIGFQFNDYSLMDGTVSTEQDLVNWLQQRGFTTAL
jgi:hypothetical protein